MKNKQRIGFGIVGILTIILCSIRDRQKKKVMKDVKEQMNHLKANQQAFCFYQEEENREITERLDLFEEEIVSTLEHMEHLIEEMCKEENHGLCTHTKRTQEKKDQYPPFSSLI